MAKAFPKKLFVKTERADGEVYFVADDGVEGMVEVGERRKVAVYQLSHVQEIEGLVRTVVGRSSR